MKSNTPDEIDEIAKWIYEATRIEAEWSERPIVPEPWEKRDEKFRRQFVDIIGKYIAMEKLPTPAEAHESWNQAYYKMGWKYGEIRDTEAKTHPDLVPFDELPQPEKDKDAIFLAFVWLAQALHALITAARIETEKAYGGCHKCYGKGYATTLDYSSGYGTDGDIGGYEGPIRFRNNIIRYCTCDRGKQLTTLTNDKIGGGLERRSDEK